MLELLAATTKSAAAASSLSIWGAVLVACISGLFGLVGYWLKWYLDSRKDKKKNALKKFLHLYNNVYNTINDELQRLGAQRILILKVENGGGVPRPGAQLFTSVVWEAFDPPVTSIQKDWQRLRVDAEHSDIISNLIHYGNVRLVTEELCANSLIRSFCEAASIKKVEEHHVHANETRILYLSIAYTEDVEMDASFRRIRTSVLVNNISQIMEKMEEIEKYAA